MDACPACTASMRDGDLHCDNEDCLWMKCGRCKALIDMERGTYWTATVWGNQEGYLKADG
jgi:ferredoxin-like protein FixX